MSEQEKNPVGRPTLYREDYHNEHAFNYCLLGATDEDLARSFNIAVSTLNLWKETHSQFMDSIRGGREEADAKVAASLYKRATGYQVKKQQVISFQGEVTEIVELDEHVAPDTRAIQFWLKNRSKAWKDKQEVDIEISSLPQIIIKRAELNE